MLSHNIVCRDAHPVHLHLVKFEVLSRHAIIFDNGAQDEAPIYDSDPAVSNGTYLVNQPLIQHNGEIGQGFRVGNPTMMDEPPVDPGPEYYEKAPKDMVTALPGQVTLIKATFDKPGRYVWHCHILSHEDHEMMRVLHVCDNEDCTNLRTP